MWFCLTKEGIWSIRKNNRIDCKATRSNIIQWFKKEESNKINSLKHNKCINKDMSVVALKLYGDERDKAMTDAWKTCLQL